MEKKRYCKIEFCENYHGTTDSRVHFFLLPVAGEYRIRWIERIMMHQNFDSVRHPKFLICDVHFDQRCLRMKDDRVALKKGTIPTVFPKRPVTHVEPYSRRASGTSSDPLGNNIEIVKEPIEESDVEMNDPTDPLNSNRQDDVPTQGLRVIRLVDDPPKDNRDIRIEPIANNNDIVNWLIKNPPSNNSNTLTNTSGNGDGSNSEPIKSNDCKRCHELAVELSMTTIKIFEAEEKIKEQDKVIKRKSKNLRITNSELKKNNAMANDLYANDSNEELENDEEQEDEEERNGKEAKPEKKKRKFFKKGRHLPYEERQQFHQDVLNSLNQMSDECALQAMMDIQGFIKKIRDASVPNK